MRWQKSLKIPSILISDREFDSRPAYEVTLKLITNVYTFNELIKHEKLDTKFALMDT